MRQTGNLRPTLYKAVIGQRLGRTLLALAEGVTEFVSNFAFCSELPPSKLQMRSAPLLQSVAHHGDIEERSHTASLDFVGEIERIQTEQKHCLPATLIKASGAIIRTAALGCRSSSLMFLSGAPW